MVKLITITSGKGGVGKTTTAINLGAALNALGKEVIIVDANVTTPNVGLHFGAPIVPVNLNHVLLGKASIYDAIYEHESGIKIIPSSLSVKDMKKINPSKLKKVVNKLKRVADYIVLDSAAGLGVEAIAAMEAGDDLIIVTNPEIPAVTDALKTSKVIENLGKSVKGVIISRVKDSKSEMPLSNIKDMLELPILGVVPEDGNVPASVNLKDALVHTHPNSRASKAYMKIASRIAGIPYKARSSWIEKLFGL